MNEKWVIRQQIRTVHKSWLETIYEGSERVMRGTYASIVKNFPNEYFELVKVSQDEECLEFTPIKS